jgi:hypothetical protein
MAPFMDMPAGDIPNSLNKSTKRVGTSLKVLRTSISAVAVAMFAAALATEQGYNSVRGQLDVVDNTADNDPER